MPIRKRAARVNTLPTLALRGIVPFPGVMMHLDVGRPQSLAALNASMAHEQTVFMVAQKDVQQENPADEDLYETGVVARVHQVLRLPGDNLRIMAEGLYRARVDAWYSQDGIRMASVREKPDRHYPEMLEGLAMQRECRLYWDKYAAAASISPDRVRETADKTDCGELADFVAYHTSISVAEKQPLLENADVTARMMALLKLLDREVAVQQLEESIHSQVREQMDQNQRDYYLREQMQVIASELGEDDNPVEEADEYRKRVKALALSDESRDKLLKECDKLAKMPFGSHEATVVRQYLDTCLELPWGKTADDTLDITRARQVLDEDHYGLEKVKDRIIEILAVRKLAPQIKGQILCLAGPPGVGKTSVAKSVARAMGRPYVRVSLGGVRDEADIRGHRKTYIGAMPGRIVTALKQAGVANPVMLLDEIDKMGNDFRGDPASAMLEVLDSEQNTAFVDHYIEIPFDLSQVLFITTANDIDNIPAPLYDRMDVITLPSYTAQEKFCIAKEHLLPKQMKKHGLNRRMMKISDATLRAIIEGYVREAGVRQLERTIAKICRKAAKIIVAGEKKSVTVSKLEDFLGPRRYKPEDDRRQDEVGVVNGLAWTAVGGETMPVEVAVLDGTGKIELTGSLGNVMKESAHTAVSYVRSRADRLQIPADFYKTKDIHIHVPEGAVPKDGPSAGVTMATALVSALTGRPARHDLAMTGEISLRGRVLPIGGLREKSMAAYTHHMDTVIIPEQNAPDLAEVDAVVKEHVRFVTASHLDTVIQTALLPLPDEKPAKTERRRRPAAPAAKSRSRRDEA
ncbi:MAG: endopeptidase La [Acutalibacteraceae bacterium]|jgi:ATP-dependent Lon protease